MLDITCDEPEIRGIVVPFLGDAASLRRGVAAREWSLANLALTVTTRGWRFPTLLEDSPAPQGSAAKARAEVGTLPPSLHRRTRLRPPRDTVLLKDRLLYRLQPPLEAMFGRRIILSGRPYPYQMDGIAFLMPRAAALVAD